MTTTLRRAASVRTALIACAALAAGTSIAATSAHATQETYCQQSLPAGGPCSGPRHTLVGNSAFNYYGDTSKSVCAGAEDTNHNPYGSYICGGGSAYHPYGAGALLYPLIKNNEGRLGQSMYGVLTY